MAVKANVELNLKYKEAVADLNEFQREFQRLEKRVDAVTKENQRLGEQLKDATNKGSKGIKGLVVNLKSIGKATGLIFLLTKAFETLKDIFMSNQLVVDTFQTAFNVLAFAFSDFFNFVSSNVGAVKSYFKGIFEDPVGAIKNFGNAIWENLVQRFESSLSALGNLAEAAVKVFKGDWSGALESAKNAGKDYVDAITGVPDSYEKIVEAAPKALEAVKDYAQTTVERSVAAVKANKELELSEIAFQQTQLQSQILAERQRQIRDDVTKSIKDRIIANDELNVILKEQLENEKQMALNNIERVKLNEGLISQQEYDVQLAEAKLKLTEIQERVEAQASEQKTNRAALALEQLELESSLSEAENARKLDALNFEAQRIETEYARLLQMQYILDEETRMEQERLQTKIDAAAEGTQARQDAEQALFDFQQQQAQKQIELDELTAKSKIDIVQSTLGNLATIFGENSKIGKAAAIAQTTIDTYQAAQAAFKSMAGIPVVGPALGAIAAAAAIAGGIANINKIKSVGPPVNGPSVASQSGQAAAAGPQAPSFNIVGASGQNQIAEAIGNQAQQPVKAYVVSNEVTTSQSLERNIVEGASIG